MLTELACGPALSDIRAHLSVLELPQLFRLLAFVCIQVAQASSDPADMHFLSVVSGLGPPCMAAPLPFA
jgi:hypothetical protein